MVEISVPLLLLSVTRCTKACVMLILEEPKLRERCRPLREWGGTLPKEAILNGLRAKHEEASKAEWVMDHWLRVLL